MNENNKAKRRFFNRTLLSWHAIGLLFLPGIFMPQCTGCNSEVHYASDLLGPSQICVESVLFLTLTYLLPLLVAWLLTLVAISQSQRMFIVQFFFQCALLAAGLVWFVVSEIVSAIDAEGLLRHILALLPIVLAVPLWLGGPMWQRRWTFAWGRLQQLTMLVSWVLLNLMCLFNTVLLIGYWYTCATMIATVLIAEMSKGRMAHDLWDAGEPIEKFRFSMRAIFFWMTIVPLVGAYYRAIDWIVDKVF